MLFQKSEDRIWPGNLNYKTFINNPGVSAAKYLIWLVNNQNKSGKRVH